MANGRHCPDLHLPTLQGTLAGEEHLGAQIAAEAVFTILTTCGEFQVLRMNLTRNKTSANRRQAESRDKAHFGYAEVRRRKSRRLNHLNIIYDAGTDLYNMRFYRKTFSKKTFGSNAKDIETHESIFFDILEEIFTQVTGLYIHF